MYKIYFLFDIKNPTIPKYIGSSKQKYLSKRKAQHVEKAKLEENNSNKDKWVNSCDKIGVTMLEDGIATLEEALKREDYFIDKFKSTITNMTGAKSVPPKMGGYNKIELEKDVINRLGFEPDYKIANDIGVSKYVIARRRKKLGIKSYAEQTGNSGQFKKGYNRWL